MEPISILNLPEIFGQFALGGEILDFRPLSAGHINDTFYSRVRTPAGERGYVHQRINHRVFQHPDEVMENIVRVTQHARCEIESSGGDPTRRTLQLVPTRAGEWFYRTSAGDTWRTYHAIEGARTHETPQNAAHVYRAARAFGQFQRLLSTLPGERLHETIPDFHHTPKRFAYFARIAAADPCGRVQAARAEVEFVLSRETDTGLAVERLARGELPERVIHNDTKLNNVLIDDQSGEALCVLDLDTVMPGTVLYDFGDMVRAGAATAGEDEPDLDQVRLDLEGFRQLALGYTSAAGAFLTPLEWELLPQAGHLITLEQGLRFLGDHLQGDAYYKIHHPGHNLERARTQLKLVAEMEAHLDEMRAIVEACRQR